MVPTGIIKKLAVVACICSVIYVGFTYYMPRSRISIVKPHEAPLMSKYAEGELEPDPVDSSHKDKTYSWKRDHPKMAKIRHMCNDPEGIKILEEGLHPAEYQLKGVVVVTRHGERSPQIPFRGLSKFNCALDQSSPHVDEYKNFLNTVESALRVNDSAIVPDAFRRRRVSSRRGGCEPWELTQTGAVQALLNGRAISDLFLDQDVAGFKKFHPRNDVVVYSTRYSRTLESALAFWAGFTANHPRNDAVKNNVADQWPKFEQLQHSVAFCFRRCQCKRAQLLQEAQKKTMSRFLREHPAVLDLAASMSRILYPPDENGKVKNRWPGDLMESLVLWLCHNKPFPCSKGASKDESKACVKPQHVASLSTYEDRADDLKDDVKMALQGFGLAEEISRLAETRFFKNKTKLVLFSGHDYSVEYLLSVFGLKKELPPIPFSARVVLEFYENSKNPEDRRFRLLYNGKDRTSRIPFCSAPNEDSPTLLDIGEEARVWQSVRDPYGANDPSRQRSNRGAGEDSDSAPQLLSMCPFEMLRTFVRSGFFGEHNGSSYEEICQAGRPVPRSSSKETVL